MNLYHRIVVCSGVLIVLALSSFAIAQDNTKVFKLKPGAYVDICLKCHTAFKEKLKKAFIHTPVKKECTGCHNPHTSSHGKLLAGDVKTICTKCHQSVIPVNALSVHKPVADGDCMKCHDPHSAANKDNLILPGKALCFSCHKSMGETIAKVKYKHNPVEKGCFTCHLVHASSKGEFLLKEKTNVLCVGCHKTDSPIFQKQHMNYPVANANCTGCHDPHGSDMPGILYNNVHSPVASRMCNQCHDESTSPNPLKIKKEGYELCRGCHNKMLVGVFDKNQIHWPLLSKRGCLSCHSPHAAPRKGLLKADQITLCGKCHADTIERQIKSVTKHEPVMSGKCTSCHDPHSSSSQYLFKEPTIIDQCGKCHDWMTHSTHPIGNKVRDPRNKNLSLQCLSCHRAHGSEYKDMFPFPSTTDLCIECHEKFRR
jgi:predicted CXXCH cytochrome family protein